MPRKAVAIRSEATESLFLKLLRHHINLGLHLEKTRSISVSHNFRLLMNKAVNPSFQSEYGFGGPRSRMIYSLQCFLKTTKTYEDMAKKKLDLPRILQ